MTVDVPERPLLKPWYRLASHPERTILEHGHVAVVFEGRATERLLPALLPLLDGTHSVADLVTALGEPAAPAVHNALALLARHRLLTEGPQSRGDSHPLADETARFLSSVARGDQPPSRVADALAEATVAVVGSGPVAEHVARLLRLSGIGELERAGVGEPPAEAVLAVVAPEGAELRDLPEWNRLALAAGTSWLPVLPLDGRFAGVGPLVVPGETACYECYRIRRASNLEYAEEFWLLEDVPRPAAAAPALLATLGGLATIVVLRWLVERDAELPGVLIALEPAGAPRVWSHNVYRVPRCPACSDAEQVAPAAPWFDGELLA
jgi:bacteriocin biosynthesis cyclodehydratase domain-containing protein